MAEQHHINMKVEELGSKTMRKSLAILLIVALTVAMMSDGAESWGSGRRRRRRKSLHEYAGAADRQERAVPAGDGTGSYFGFVHGAFFEGERVADAIATCVGGGPCEKEYQPPRRGCTCPAADNFDNQATVDDGSCLYPTSGGDRFMPFSTFAYLLVWAAYVHV
uniref:Uncharacterized protein n=1 Tax=Branchiostoma floridae TaxID=7739 RepID=C3Z9Q9_BRAFL|eukprot:XP_002594744.1 hypothetical protein BRAFLDRAFT_122802 [Branchiostoma floridae]